jgi:2-polyprenyl-3-methyl-5-hydroxy-6-metoxy-1,4-benzoquinol methylase
LTTQSSSVNAQQLYDRVWHDGFQQGIEDFGDLEMSLEFIRRTGLLQHSHTILEIGSGIGRLCDALMKLGYTHLTGTDISKAAVEYGKQKFSQINLQHMDATRLEFLNQSFDIALSFDLVEHIPDLSRHLAEVHRILKPGGKYLLQTPNLFSNALYCTIRYRGLGWRQYHPSLQTHWSLRDKLLQAGFTAVEFVRMPVVSDYRAQFLPGSGGKLLKMIPWDKLPLLLQTNYYVIAHR